MRHYRRKTSRRAAGNNGTPKAIATIVPRWNVATESGTTNQVTFVGPSLYRTIMGFQITALDAALGQTLGVFVVDGDGNNLDGWLWQPTVASPYFNKMSYSRSLNGVAVVLQGTSIATGTCNCLIKTMTT